MSEVLSHRAQAMLQILKEEFPVYSEECLQIKTKTEGIQAFIMNRVQHYLLEAFQDQLARIGMVRKIIVKGRQQTCSTLITGLGFHIAQFNPGTDVYIMSHETKSTKGLFKKILLYNEAVQKNHPLLSHATVVENSTELEFTNKSTYGVGTAGEGNTGRSLTITFFHGSEPAFWENPELIKAGALQTVALKPGTWVILESTANGINWFYHMCLDARKGIGIYELIFIPWVWTDEYRLPIPPGMKFERTIEETKCADILRDTHDWEIDDEQLYWRRMKIAEIGPRMFKQEYPNTFEEAFQYSSESFYDMEKVAKAMAIEPFEVYGARIAGVDVGRDRVKNPNGKPDRTVIVRRRGRSIYKKEVFEEMSHTKLCGILCKMIDDDEIDHIFLDYALGGPVYDLMCERGYGRWVTCVDFGESPMEDQYANKRAEIHCLFDEWLREGPVSIIKDDEITTDISMMPHWELNSNSRKVFPEKKKIREKFGRSPDVLDAIVLTFSYPVAADAHSERVRTQTVNTARGSSLTAQRELRRLANDSTSGNNTPRLGPKAPGRRYT